MIQLIGFMIAAYIVTRMIELIVNKETKSVVEGLAVITIVIVFMCVAGLFLAGSDMALNLGQIPK